jgi:hypothetical protein
VQRSVLNAAATLSGKVEKTASDPATTSGMVRSRNYSINGRKT